MLSVPCSEHSSDTDSIASTGPMLDDDQVELLTLDFTENSIAETSPKHTAHHQHFAHHRTSLPPTLSHLEAFLERSPGEGGFHLVGTREDGRSADGTDELKEDASQNTAKEGEDVDVSVDICLDDQSGR